MAQLEYARDYSERLHDDSTALKIYNKLLLSLVEAGDDSLLLIAQTERMELLRQTGRRDELLSALNEGIASAKRLQDYRLLSNQLNLKGLIYTQVGFKKEAVKILEQSYQSAMRIRDKDWRNFSLGYLSAIQSNTTERSEDRVFHFTQSYNYFMQVGEEFSEYRAAQITGNSSYASSFMEQGQLDSAMHYLSASISHIDADHFLSDDFYAIINFSAAQSAYGDHAEAEKWLLYALKQAKYEGNRYHQSIVYYNLYSNLLLQDNILQANAYLHKYASLKSYLHDIQLRCVSLIESDLNDSMNRTSLAASKKLRIIILLFTSVVFLSYLTIGWFYLRSRNEKDLPAQDIDTFPLSIDKEVSVEQIKELNTMIKQGDPAFMVKFHEHYEPFLTKLNEIAEPSLNYSEMEICALTKFNYTTKDIALHRNCSVRSVESKKYRIRKKLMLNPDVDFVLWIANIQ